VDEFKAFARRGSLSVDCCSILHKMA